MIHTLIGEALTMYILYGVWIVLSGLVGMFYEWLSYESPIAWKPWKSRRERNGVVD